MGIDRQLFEKALERMKEKKGIHLDTDLDAEDLKNLLAEFKTIYRTKQGNLSRKNRWISSSLP